MSRGLSMLPLAVAAVAVTAGAALAQGAGRTINDGAYTEAQAARGKTIYADACSTCHGPDTTGGGGGPALSGPFWAAWNGRSLGELYEFTKGSMPMDGPGRLNDQEYADVLAFLLSVNHMPAGAGELAADGEALKAIAVVPRK